jgi:hypothetical protein
MKSFYTRAYLVWMTGNDEIDRLPLGSDGDVTALAANVSVGATYGDENGAGILLYLNDGSGRSAELRFRPDDAVHLASRLADMAEGFGLQAEGLESRHL